MIQKFRKKPVVIEAVQWTGLNVSEILFWIGHFHPLNSEEKLAYWDGEILRIKTLESGIGYHVADVNDWIIKGVSNEFYPCKPDIFDKTYEAV